MTNSSSEFHRRVLVIDDNPAIHEDFVKILTSNEEDDLEEQEALLFGDSSPTNDDSPTFDVDSAFQGQEGLEKVDRAVAEGRPYALAFVDVRMPPGWDGIETVKHIWERHPDLQIVICTAYTDYSWDDVLKTLGRQDGLLILKKPFDNIEVRQLATALSEKWNLRCLAGLKVKDLEQRIEQRTLELQQHSEDLERQVAERIKAEKRLRHNAFHDTLTGLPNRALFLDRLAHACEKSSQRPPHAFAVLFLDLDRFKVLNDGLGHSIGDLFLIETARRLTACLRPGDTVARLGGDEFTMLLEGLSADRESTEIAQRIQSSLVEPFVIKGQELFTTASIGIALGHLNGSSPEELLRDADTAMYRAKALGKARFCMFDEELRNSAIEMLQLANDLQRAVERGQLRLEYQPIVAVDSGRIRGSEALLRWEHPDRGLLPPGLFIPIAEETLLINTIGEWVLRTACQQNKKWQDQGLPHIYVSVNVSGVQIRQSHFPRMIEQVLQQTGLDACWLKLELTESTLMSDTTQIVATLKTLADLGVGLAMDDFGTGYSSMSYLQDLPISTLKIDRSFIASIDPDSTSPSGILKALTTLARCLNMEVTAEGVETQGQMDVLRVLDCAEAQGYLCERPMPASRFVELLRSRSEGLAVLAHAVTAEQGSETCSEIRKSA